MFKNPEETLCGYNEQDIDETGKYLWKDQVPRYIGRAFKNCEALVSMDIPEGVERIEDEAFYDCRNLKHIKIPESVCYVGKKAFWGCSNVITEFEGAEYVDHWLVGVHPLTEVLEVRSGTIGIAYDAFHNCESVKHIILPNCELLKSISLPKGLRYICEEGRIDHKIDVYVDSLEDWCQLFLSVGRMYHLTSQCQNLFVGKNKLMGDVIFPDGIEQITAHAFWGQADIKQIYLPRQLKKIGLEAFSCCKNLEGVIFPSGLEAIGQGAFCNCSNLKINLLPDSLTFIGPDAFQNTKCYGRIIIPDGVKTIGPGAFGGCSEITEVILPKGLNEIGACAFKGCTGIQNIAIPDHVGVIKEAAFRGCSCLKEVKLGNGVKEIPPFAFADCVSLETITLPECVERIHKNAFQNCPALKQMVICNSNTTVPEELFENTTLEVFYINGKTLISREKVLSNVFDAIYEGKTLDEAIAIGAMNHKNDARTNAVLGVYFKSKPYHNSIYDTNPLRSFIYIKPLLAFKLGIYRCDQYRGLIIGHTTCPYVFDFFQGSFLMFRYGTVEAVQYSCSIAGWSKPVVHSGEAILDVSLKPLLKKAGMTQKEIENYTFRKIYPNGIPLEQLDF